MRMMPKPSPDLTMSTSKKKSFFSWSLLCLCLILASCGSSDDSIAAYGQRAAPSVAETPTPEPEPSEPEAPLIDAVVVIGDSLTVGTEMYGVTLTQSLFNAGVSNVYVSAENGRTTQQGIIELERLSVVEGAVILALGTNDVAAGSPEEFGELIDRAVTAVPNNVDIYWLNLYTDQWISDDTYNAKIDQRADLHANLFVMDFESFATTSWLEEDGIHLSPEGYVNRAAFILAELGVS